MNSLRQRPTREGPPRLPPLDGAERFGKPIHESHGGGNDLAKSPNAIKFVIPAKAGIQLFQDVVERSFRRGENPRDLLRDRQKRPSKTQKPPFGRWFTLDIR